MIEKALVGDRRYWSGMALLLAFVIVGGVAYLRQLENGLGVTGLSRSASWGLYIGQFAFFDGIAASAMVVVLLFYLHNDQRFGNVALLGELLAVAGVVMSMLFVVVDLGQPTRVLNVLLYPSPHSLMFWDIMSLSGYLALNGLLAFGALRARGSGLAPKPWLKPVAYLCIPWAIAIQTVSAFLFSGLAARPLWMTAVLVPRFLASALAAGMALLILLIFALGRLLRRHESKAVVDILTRIVIYAAALDLLLVAAEMFTGFYSGVVSDHQSLVRQFLAAGEAGAPAAWMWGAAALMIGALALLSVPGWRRSPGVLAVACAGVFLSAWMDKGVAFIVGGFEVATPVPAYRPSMTEWAVAAGIWALGALMATVFCKIAATVRAPV